MSKRAAFSATVHGRVQGVWFRAFVEERARILKLAGNVRNLPDGRTLEVKAEGEEAGLLELLKHLRKGPPLAKVERVDVQWSDYSGEFKDFRVT